MTNAVTTRPHHYAKGRLARRDSRDMVLIVFLCDHFTVKLVSVCTGHYSAECNGWLSVWLCSRQWYSRRVQTEYKTLEDQGNDAE